MKKILFTIFTILCVFSLTKVSAEEYYIEELDQASIRLKTENSLQGLRFMARLGESVKENDHGFYLVYGKSYLEDFVMAKEFNTDEVFKINDKKVFKVPVLGYSDNNYFSVVLTGIPEVGYFDEITVFSYVVIDGVERFSEAGVTRSVASVIFNMANEGLLEEKEEFMSVFETNKKSVIRNTDGVIFITSGAYELDYNNLFMEFIKDWNKVFDEEFTYFNQDTFFDTASVGLNYEDIKSNDNLMSSNLYKFFNDERVNEKWSWLLDYLLTFNDEDVNNQIKAINNNLNDKVNLYNGISLSYSIINFFSGDYYDNYYKSIDFSSSNKYESLRDYNNKIYLNLNYSTLYNEGENLLIYETEDKEGYKFSYYEGLNDTYYAGDLYIIDQEDILIPHYELINYSIRFYDEELEINSLKDTYNINDEVVLPVYEKEGYNFLGWYDNDMFYGEALKIIEEGSIGEICLYALVEVIMVNVSYDLNYDPAPVYDDSLLEYGELLNKPSNPTRSGYTFLGWFKNDEEFNFNEPIKDDITIVAKWEKIIITYKVTFINDGEVNEVIVNENELVTKPVEPIKEGYNFLGWYKDEKLYDFNEEVNEDLILTAKWEEVIDPNEEFTITFNLNGGAWPTTAATPGYTNRDVMIKDFLTDFYNFVSPSGVSLNDFLHGAGKTSGYDGLFKEHVNVYGDVKKLYELNDDKKVDASKTNIFIKQAKYNKWVPLLDLIDEYTNKVNSAQYIWSSWSTFVARITPFINKDNYGKEDVTPLVNKIPDKLKGSTPGVAIEVPANYKRISDDITLPTPEKSGDNFMGWYDNINYQGEPLTKILKGSSGNKVFYARYNSTVVPEVPLTDEEKIQAAKSALSITYSSGDNASNVKENITLPATGLHGAIVTWATSNSDVITAAGVVTQNKEKEENVTLTATIKLANLTETKEFNLTVKKEGEKPTTFTIKYNLDGGKFGGYNTKNELADAFLTDLFAFVSPADSITVFKHGNGQTSGFNGTWFSNDDYKGKIYGANIKSGNNNYFLSHSTYQAKWKPFADFMVDFVKVGNPDQDFWTSPYTGNIRLNQYFTNVKPSDAWSDDDMAKIPTGMSANVYYEYNINTPTITLPTITKPSYTFEGWYDNAAFTGNKITSIPAGSTGNKEFYAKWSQPVFTITLNLNSGSIAKYSKANLKDAFLNDLYSFIRPSETLAQFKGGIWFSNEEYKNMIYGANIKSGNNNYFLSSDLYQAKWKPLADFMVNFVKKNPAQDFWSSPFTGIQRLKQYFDNTKPSAAWTDADMSATPAAIKPAKYMGGSQAVILPPASRSGYKFEGWFTANTGGTKVTQIAAGATGNQTFYARWTSSLVTSTGPRYFQTEAQFRASPAYKTYTAYANRVVYDKSFAIPGLVKTNINGSAVTHMTPQGLTYANGYFLISAYHYNDAYNSVIYVIDSNGNFKVTIILPNKAHVGGLAFDGSNIFVSNTSSRVSSFKYSHVTAAINSGREYYQLPSYQKTYSVATTASFLGYYNNMLWVGRFDAAELEYMYGYTVGSKTGTPTLTRKHHIQVPNRTQGVAFSANGGIILVRSYGRNPASETYISEIRFYKPSWSVPRSDGLIYKNDAVKTLKLPPMGEGAVRVGNYFYVVFESAATTYSNSPHITDRVIAFNVGDFL